MLVEIICMRQVEEPLTHEAHYFNLQPTVLKLETQIGELLTLVKGASQVQLINGTYLYC